MWLSSERRPISEPAPGDGSGERRNGHAPDLSKDDGREHPPSAVVEVPDGGPVEPGV
ncbi:hypothetical protein GCM10025868_29570 [Angustibacter aerolatus]|uniref:Uncharacterized protein n=1 Tax=Angustibacter aerolatus TaxID=1162965 RepID=A0ABQ6JLI3_9ACTN|nr:hypothetical protein GCM10025868_29570 [Angustibacter aerolatus]